MNRTRMTIVLAGLVAGCAEDEGHVWADFDREQRLQYMTQTVLPTMREIFVARDPQRYASFACESCHGADMLDVDYAMPNALFPLPLDGTLDAARAQDEQMTQFMLDEVFPTMVELLDEDKYSEATGKGYRCVGCHLVADG